MEVQLRRLGPHNQIIVLPETNKETTWTAGRGSNCDIYILSRYVSRTHFLLKCRNNNFYVCDLGSANGTYINDKRMCSQQEYPLPLGSIISVGVASFHQNDPDCIVFAFETHKKKQLKTGKLKIEEEFENVGNGEEEVNMEITRADTKLEGKGKKSLVLPVATEQFPHISAFNDELKVEIIEVTKNSDSTEKKETPSHGQDNHMRLHKSGRLCENSTINELITNKIELTAIQDDKCDLTSSLPESSTAVQEEIDLFEPEGCADDEIVDAFEAQTQVDDPVTKNSHMSYSMTEEYIEVSDTEDDALMNIKTEMENVNFIKTEPDEDDYDGDVLCFDITKSENKENYPLIDEIKIEDADEYTETDMKWMDKLFKTKEECCSFIQSQRENVSGESGEHNKDWVELVKSCAEEVGQILLGEVFDEETLLGTTGEIYKRNIVSMDKKPLDILDTDNTDSVGRPTTSQEIPAHTIESQTSGDDKEHIQSTAEPSTSGEQAKIIKLYDPYESEDYSAMLQSYAKKRKLHLPPLGETPYKILLLHAQPPKESDIIKPEQKENKSEKKATDEQGRKQVHELWSTMKGLEAAQEDKMVDFLKAPARLLEVGKEQTLTGKNVEGPPNVAGEGRSTQMEYELYQQASGQPEDDSNINVFDVLSGRQLKSCIKKGDIVPKKTVTFDDTESIRSYDRNVVITKKTSLFCPYNPPEIISEENILRHKYAVIFEICKWNAKWLEECTRVPAGIYPPPFQHENLKKVQKFFHDRKNYVATFVPLILLELWHVIANKWKINSSGLYRFPADLICYNARLHKNLGRINCECMMEVSTIKSHGIKEGNLVVIQLTKPSLDHKGEKRVSKKLVLKIFGYLEKVTVTKRVPPGTDPTSAEKSQCSALTTVLTLDILIAKRGELLADLCNTIQITGIYHTTPYVIMCHAVSLLWMSPLSTIILAPSKLAMTICTEPYEESIKFNGPLDNSQRELILKLVTSCSDQTHGLMQIQGGPGTGKSHVIIALIEQLLKSKLWKRTWRPVILYCAHSDISVDSVTLKLKKYWESTSEETKFKLVRYGRIGLINPEAREVSTWVLGQRNDKYILENQIKSLDEKINVLLSDLEDPDKLTEAAAYEKRSELHACVNERVELKNLEKSLATDQKPTYGSECYVIEEADVICTTFGSSGSKTMLNAFEKIKLKAKKRKIICIVDEAMQSRESETVIPLMLGVTHLILFGDSQQFRSPVQCDLAERCGLNQSLFWRIMTIFNEGETPVFTLRNQYRMNSAISNFPSRLFYHDSLKYSVKSKKSYGIHDYTVLIDDAPATASIEDCEMGLNEIAINLVSEILKTMGDDIPKNNFGVITFKTEILEKIREGLDRKLDKQALSKLELNLVEKVQGQEYDIVVAIIEPNMVSHARANVGLTRAKHSLIIIISNPAHKYNKFLSKLAEDACARGVSKYVASLKEGPMLKKLVSKPGSA